MYPCTGAPGLRIHFEGDPRSRPFQKAVRKLHSPQCSSGVCSEACYKGWDWGQFTELWGPHDHSLRTRPASPLSQPLGRGLLAAHSGVLRLSAWKQNPPGALGLADGRGLGHRHKEQHGKSLSKAAPPGPGLPSVFPTGSGSPGCTPTPARAHPLSRVGLCDPMDYSPPGSLCPWDSAGKNPGAGCHFLLQGFSRQ